VALGPRQFTSSGISVSAQGISGSIDARQTVARNGDSGWQVHASHGKDKRLFAEAEHRASWASLRGGLDSSNGRLTAQLGTSGAQVWIGGNVLAANAIRDSFAVVDTVGQPGIPVYQDRRLVGRTNSRGKLILPDLRAFEVSNVSIDPGAVSLTAILTSNEIEVRPARGAGALVRFDIRSQSVALVTLVDSAGKPIAVGASARLTSDNSRAEPVGYDGLVYLQGVRDNNELEVSLADGGSCSARFAAPKDATGIRQTGPIPCIRKDLPRPNAVLVLRR